MSANKNLLLVSTSIERYHPLRTPMAGVHGANITGVIISEGVDDNLSTTTQEQIAEASAIFLDVAGERGLQWLKQYGIDPKGSKPVIGFTNYPEQKEYLFDRIGRHNHVLHTKAEELVKS